jgi:hypothetical protein
MKTARKRLMTWLIILLSLYVIYCGLLFFFQTKLIFPSEFAGQPSQALPTLNTEVIELATDEGKTTAWFVPALQASPETPAPLAMFFHGNAELMDHQSGIVDLYQRLGVSVLMVEYRGYGHSEGSPSQAHIMEDSLAVMEQVIKRDDVDASKLTLHGRSIGGGLASQVALKSPPRALIVESTGTSVAGMAMKYGVPPFLVRSPLNTREAFTQLDLPILIMHGKDDEIFPVSHAHRLDDAGKQTTLVLFNASHNTLPSGSEIDLYERSVGKHLRDAEIIP